MGVSIMSSLEFRVDPASKSLVKVTESATTEDELRAELQAAADAAQNRLNGAQDAKAQADAALVSAQEAVQAADAEVVAAQEAVSFSSDKLGKLSEMVAILQGLDESPAEAAAAEDAPEESEAVDIPVRVVEDSPA